MDAGQRRRRLLGWGLTLWGVIQAVSLVIGLSGMPDDLETWGTRWLPTAWKWMSDLPIGLNLVLPLLLLLVGIWILARERFEPIPAWYRRAANLVRSRPWRRSRAEREESPLATEEENELEDHEAAALRVVAEHVDEPGEGITPHEFQRRMAHWRFSGTDATLALASLSERGMLERLESEHPDGYIYVQYRLTSASTRWLSANRPSQTEDDDIPF